MHNIYSWPSLVVPYSEEPFSRPFLGENWFWLVLQKRMSTENAVGCLFFSHAHFCLQLQQYSLAPMVLVAGFSSGFPMLRTTSICQGTNPCEQKWEIWPSTTTGTMVFCWSCKQSERERQNKQPTAFSVLIRFWSTHQNLFSPRNGREISSSVFGTTRLGQL